MAQLQTEKHNEGVTTVTYEELGKHMAALGGEHPVILWDMLEEGGEITMMVNSLNRLKQWESSRENLLFPLQFHQVIFC